MNIGVMYKIRSILPLQALHSLYNTTILPHFTYCNLIWGRASATLVKIILVLQKQVIRLCTGSHYRAHTKDLFRRLGVLPLFNLISYETGIFMYKYKHNIASKCFRKLLHNPPGNSLKKHSATVKHLSSHFSNSSRPKSIN